MFLLSTGKFLFLSCPRATFPLNLFLPPNNKVLSLPPSCCFFNNPLVSSIIAWQHVWIHCIAGVSEKDTFVREQTDRKHRKRKGHTELLEWERPDTLADELQESTVTHHITAKKKNENVLVIADSTMLLWNRQQNQNHWQMMLTFTQRICAT